MFSKADNHSNKLKYRYIMAYYAVIKRQNIAVFCDIDGSAGLLISEITQGLI